MKLARRLPTSIAGALLLLAHAPADAAGMQVSSTSFADSGTITVQYGHDGAGSDGASCGGKGVSPQLSWSSLPAGTRSLAIMMWDPDGADGMGVSHWVAYNVTPELGQLKEGEGKTDGHGVTLGKNVRGEAAYRGPCPPVGDVPHHYTITVYATRLEAGALQPGLTRDELFAALKGNTLAAMSIVGRYGR
jgi:Raf kinase inhibitor-like YbhB/YbcL family protein